MGTELPEQFRELGHILHCGTVCPDHPELLVKDPCGNELGFGQQAGLLKHGEKPCMAGFVQIDGFTADGRVRLGQSAPFSPCAGTLFLVVHIYVFYVVQLHRVALPPSVSPPQFATSEQIAAPCKGQAVFAAKRSGAAKNTACYVQANINLSSPKRKERFRGKAGIDDRRRQTAHFRLDAAKLGSDIISCISPILATLCQIEATCTHRWNRRKNGRPMMAEPTAEDVPEWDA